MLVTLKEILEIEEAYNCAVGSFNTPNLESIMAVIGAAEELDVPVVIQHAQVHEEIIPISVIGPIMIECAKNARVPVCVHLDHGETLNYVHRALNLGFTSVMYDGSNLPFAENVANTKVVTSMARRTGASVEAEIGCMGKRETGLREDTSASGDAQKIYTDPEEARKFVEATGIDALACSFGTSHGIYVSDPKLDMGVLDRVRAKVKVPIVMHGGSGIKKEDFDAAIQRGVRKVNYYTYMAKAGGSTVADKFRVDYSTMEYGGKRYKLWYTLVEEGNEVPVFYHDIVSWGISAMREDAIHAMKIFARK